MTTQKVDFVEDTKNEIFAELAYSSSKRVYTIYAHPFIININLFILSSVAQTLQEGWQLSFVPDDLQSYDARSCELLVHL